MSWIEKIQTDLIITTGDGQQFSPQWLNASKAVEYNVAEFDFANVEGTLVKRGTVRGSKYNLEIHFQGENHLDDALAFEISAADPRAWTVSHPFYGEIIVQPASLIFDNSKYNVTTITGTVTETITEDNPRTTVVPADKIAADKAALDETFAAGFAAGEPPDTADINSLTANNTAAYTEGAKAVSNTPQAEEYFNLFNTANAAVLNATAEPLLAIRATQAALNYPAQFEDSVTNRLNVFTTQLDSLHAGVPLIDTASGKRIYENNAGALVSSMAVAAATPQAGNYNNRTSVLAVINIIINYYNIYITDVDSLQSANGGSPGSYIPGAANMQAISNLIKYTVSVLFDIALNARQERTVILENDSNAILLAHRFYGLKADDSTINELITTNNIGINELLQVRKGRTIVYYV